MWRWYCKSAYFVVKVNDENDNDDDVRILNGATQIFQLIGILVVVFLSGGTTSLVVNHVAPFNDWAADRYVGDYV